MSVDGRPKKPKKRSGDARTTIALTRSHLTKLRELAARRGEKGYSRLIAEALEVYFGADADEAKRRAKALAAAGSLTDAEGDEALERIRRLRETWR